jgi:hypothetical protein
MIENLCAGYEKSSHKCALACHVFEVSLNQLTVYDGKVLLSSLFCRVAVGKQQDNNAKQ